MSEHESVSGGYAQRPINIVRPPAVKPAHTREPKYPWRVDVATVKGRTMFVGRQYDFETGRITLELKPCETPALAAAAIIEANRIEEWKVE